MSVNPSRKRKLSVTSKYAPSSRGLQDENDCVPAKARKLAAPSKVSVSLCLTFWIIFLWLYLSVFVLDFNKSDPIYLFLEISAKRNWEVHRGHGFKKVSGLEFSTFGDCEINF